MVTELKGLAATGSIITETRSWSGRDAALYAFACGLGREPRQASELPYLVPRAGMPVMPTFVSALAGSRITGEDSLNQRPWRLSAERVLLHRSITESGAVDMETRQAESEEYPEDGTVTLHLDARNGRGEQVFTTERTLASAAASPADPNDSGMPGRAPDLSFDQALAPEDVLLFALATGASDRQVPGQAPGGEWVDPLCTWGVACRAILSTICDFDATLVRSLSGRFPAMARPGESLTTDMWQQANVVFFRVTAGRDQRLVLSHGRCELAV